MVQGRCGCRKACASRGQRVLLSNLVAHLQLGPGHRGRGNRDPKGEEKNVKRVVLSVFVFPSVPRAPRSRARVPEMVHFTRHLFDVKLEKIAVPSPWFRHQQRGFPRQNPPCRRGSFPRTACFRRKSPIVFFTNGKAGKGPAPKRSYIVGPRGRCKPACRSSAAVCSTLGSQNRIASAIPRFFWVYRVLPGFTGFLPT